MHKFATLLLCLLALLAAAALPAVLQQEENCTPQALTQQQAELNTLLAAADFTENPQEAFGLFYTVGLAYQQMALDCGYQPTEEQLMELAISVAQLIDPAVLLAARAVGDDVEAILQTLEERGIYGDAFNGQLLYNGLVPGLDGTALGCSGCHSGPAAPATEALWTRVVEIRLEDPLLEDYSVQQYLVESIIHPQAYVVPGYLAELMPTYYGSRMDLQQLADLVAYLESQDQFIEDE